MLGLDQLVNQRGRGREAHPVLLPAGRHRQCREPMGFAGAAVPYKDDRLRFREVVALSKFMNLLGGDLGIACEVELRERLHPRQTGFVNAPFDQPLLAFLEFGLQQRFEIAEVGPPFAHCLFG